MAKVFPKSLAARRHLCRSDAAMKSLVKRVGGVRIELNPEESVFESLARSIVYQQLHGKAAATIFGRFIKLFSESDVCPHPEKVVEEPFENLRSAGLSRAKATAIQDLAKKTLEGIIPSRQMAETLTDAELIEALTQVKGIGRWTVEMFLIFTLGRTDVFPIHDYGVRKGYAVLYRKRKLPTPKQLEKLGEKWKPYRSAAAWYLWRALE